MLYSSSAVGRELIHNRSDCWYVRQLRLCLVTGMFLEVFKINQKKKTKTTTSAGQKVMRKMMKNRTETPLIWVVSCEKLDPAVQCYMLHVMTSVMCRCDAAVVRWDEISAGLVNHYQADTHITTLTTNYTLNTITVNTLNLAKLSHCYNPVSRSVSRCHVTICQIW